MAQSGGLPALKEHDFMAGPKPPIPYVRTDLPLSRADAPRSWLPPRKQIAPTVDLSIRFAPSSATASSDLLLKQWIPPPLDLSSLAAFETRVDNPLNTPLLPPLHTHSNDLQTPSLQAFTLPPLPNSLLHTPALPNSLLHTPALPPLQTLLSSDQKK